MLVVPSRSCLSISPAPQSTHRTFCALRGLMLQVSAIAQQQVVSQTDYDYQLLKLGMTLTDAQATLGRAIEVSRDETTATYKWVNSDGSAITAVFKGDRLVSKEQLGLK